MIFCIITYFVQKKNNTLRKTVELGFKINYEDAERSVIGKNATDYFLALSD